MKNLFLVIILLVFSACSSIKEEPKESCWVAVFPNAQFPFVISALNVCNGPEGGTYKWTVIQPMKDYIDILNDDAEKRRKEQLLKKLY